MSGIQAGQMLALQIVTLLICIGAFVVAFNANRRSDRAQMLKLRLSLGRELNNLHSSAAVLASVIDRAKKRSREGLAGHRTETQSGSWREADLETDGSALQKLIAQLPKGHQDLLRLSMSELEAKSLELQAVSIEISRLSEKYRD